jgi:hypothetical protein
MNAILTPAERAALEPLTIGGGVRITPTAVHFNLERQGLLELRSFGGNAPKWAAPRPSYWRAWITQRGRDALSELESTTTAEVA